MTGVLAVLVLLSGAAIVIAGYAAGAHRARAAADLAALSAAAVYQQGGDACSQARRTAAENGAALTACDLAGDLVDFVLTVRVSVPAGAVVAGLPRTIPAVAHAGPVR